MYEILYLLTELFGTVAFAASGAMTGMKKNMDLMGICILGLTTSVGGGVIRDLILGRTPPSTFQNPVYAITAIAASLLVFFTPVRHIMKKNALLYDRLLFAMDTLGLGIFTVAGIRVAYQTIEHPGLFLLVFVGTVTGVGGGLMRDMMASNLPYIFVKHVYATASIAGALLCALLWPFDANIAMAVGTVVVVVIRILARKYRWNLPRAHDWADI